MKDWCSLSVWVISTKYLQNPLYQLIKDFYISVQKAWFATTRQIKHCFLGWKQYVWSSRSTNINYLNTKKNTKLSIYAQNFKNCCWFLWIKPLKVFYIYVNIEKCSVTTIRTNSIQVLETMIYIMLNRKR